MAEPRDVLILEDFLPYRLNRQAEIISQQLAQEYKRQYGLTRPEWRVLVTIGQHEQLTATDVCRCTAMHKTKVSRAVQTLNTRRWLTRRRDQHDRRVEHLQLTALGRRNYAQLVQLARQFEQSLSAQLGKPAMRQISSALSRLEAVDS